jgi:hypothetical protein
MRARRASYRVGVRWIADNDNAGEDDAGNPDAEDNVAAYISTALLADLFNVSTERIAAEVMRIRRAQSASRQTVANNA